jgi:hypothetical protein
MGKRSLPVMCVVVVMQLVRSAGGGVDTVHGQAALAHATPSIAHATLLIPHGQAALAHATLLATQAAIVPTPEDVQASVDAGREALSGNWLGDKYPWYDSEQDSIDAVEMKPPSDFWERLWRWLSDLNFSFDFLGYTVTLFEVLAYGVLFILLAVLIFALVRIYRKRRQLALAAAAQAAAADSPIARVADVEALPPPVRKHIGDLLARAMELYREGRYTEAIVYLFSHQLVELDKHQFIRLAKGKTNRQYLGEIGGLRALREIVERTMHVFEDAFFGDYTIDRDRFEACWSQLDQFDRFVQRRGG